MYVVCASACAYIKNAHRYAYIYTHKHTHIHTQDIQISPLSRTQDFLGGNHADFGGIHNDFGGINARVSPLGKAADVNLSPLQRNAEYKQSLSPLGRLQDYVVPGMYVFVYVCVYACTYVCIYC
jgi:hypothetical protein